MLDKNLKKQFKILQLDGGGILGVMFLVFLKNLEKKYNKKCCELFDIIIGTSTGGISGALLASGKSAGEVLKLYIDNAKKIFNKRLFGFLNPKSWFSGKYDRKYIDSLCDTFLNMPMKDLKTNFILTSVNMNERNKTHFMKSFKDNYKNKITSELVKRTYSAPAYFGYYTDSEGIWADGGVGVQNCTLMESCCEIIRQQKEKNYFILSCGCGISKHTDKAHSFLGDQIKDFLPIAREQAILSQINYATELKFNFQRIDFDIDYKKNKLDGIEYIDYYITKGEEISKNILQ